MRKLRTPFVAGGIALAVAGVAVAATRDTHTMNVSLPDGSVAHVEYVGKVAPTVHVTPAADAEAVNDGGGARTDGILVDSALSPDGFAGFDRMFAAMARQHEAIMHQVAAMQQAALAQANAAQPTGLQSAVAGDAVAGGSAITRTELPGGMVLVTSGGKPAGHFSFHYVSSSTSANGCTQTVEYRSDGASAQPQVIRTSAGSCDAAKPAAPLPATAVKPVAPAAQQAGKAV